MKAIVVDASVAIKWFIPEIHAEAAMRILSKNIKLFVPDLIFAEVGNILWKKCRLKELLVDTAHEILVDFKELPFNIRESESLLDAAWGIATTYQRKFYDSLYLALSQIERCVLVTADRVLYNSLQNTDLSQFLLWVEDVDF